MPVFERGGVALHYDEIQGRGRPIVFLHGWCCNRHYFEPQVRHFAERGHRIVTVDLRGHGESGKPEGSYSIEGFADDVAWLCGELDLGQPLVVGHSMGGTVAYDLAGRHPGLVGAAAVIDASVTATQRARQRMGEFIEELARNDYQERLRAFVDKAFFIDSDDADRKKTILDDMARSPRYVMASAFDAVRRYDPTAAARGIRAPVVYIMANELPPRSDIAVLQALVPTVLIGQTVGSGHFCQLEVPDQINAMLGRFLALAQRSQ